MAESSPKVTSSIQYSRRISRGGNILGVVHLQNQNYLFTGRPKVLLKSKYGHKNPNNNHNYQDENYDAVGFYQGNSETSTSTPEQRFPPTPLQANDKVGIAQHFKSDDDVRFLHKWVCLLRCNLMFGKKYIWSLNDTHLFCFIRHNSYCLSILLWANN